jgi:guanylate kinase
MSTSGIVVTLTGPSGCGKTTVSQYLLKTYPAEWNEAVSVTTRNRRPGETEGVEYYFWNRPRFKTAVAAGEFIETIEYNGNLYGTLNSELSSKTAGGQSTIIIAEPHGVQQIRERWNGPLFRVYIRPPSQDALRSWMLARGDKPDAVESRLLLDETKFSLDCTQWDAVVLSTTIPQICDVVRRLAVEYKERVKHATASNVRPIRSPFGSDSVV